MYIIDFERCELVNIDNVISVRLERDKIVATTIAEDIVLGIYDTPERTAQVYDEMLEKCFCSGMSAVADFVISDGTSLRTVKNIKIFQESDRYYYMPKE